MSTGLTANIDWFFQGKEKVTFEIFMSDMTCLFRVFTFVKQININRANERFDFRS